MQTHARVRAFLENFAKRGTPITYQELAKALQILPPHSIHQVTEALERLMEEDAAAERPLVAALAISRASGGLPAPGFFDCARTLGRSLPTRLTMSLLTGAGCATVPTPNRGGGLSRPPAFIQVVCPAAAIRCS